MQHSIKTALRSIPALLVFTRFLLGPLIWWSIYRDMSPWWFMVGFVLARWLGVATPALRLADG